MKTNRAIAVAQTCPLAADVGANIAQHVGLIRLAAAAGARIVLFPELSLTGYELEAADALAFSECDARLAPLVEAAAAGSITVVAGAPVRAVSGLHIGAFIVQPDGSQAIYTKHHLGAFSPLARRDGSVPPAEATVFRPGAANPLVRTGDDVAALAICADAGRASHVRDAAARGASTYLASMFVIPSELERDAARLERYAVEHAMVVAMANFGGPSGGLAGAGRSGIWSATGELLVRLGANGAGVGVATATPRGWRVSHARLDGPAAAETSTPIGATAW